MSFTEQTSTSWFARLKNALVGVVFGVILVIIAVVLLFWNEGRAVATYKSLAEGLGIVVSTDAATVDPALEGKLIHIQGDVVTADAVSDELTGVLADQAIGLARKVEMFQWVEHKESRTEKKLGGGEETTTTYTYAKEWSATPEDASQFAQPDGHTNPAFPAESQEFAVPDLTIGAYHATGASLMGVGTRSPLPLSDGDAAVVGENLGLGVPVKSLAGAVYAGQNDAAPVVGDLKISYERIDLPKASIVGRQQGDSLSDYTASNGYTIFLTAAGEVPADRMFAKAQADNTLLTWALRAGGLLAMFVGFAAMLRIFSVLGDIIPFVGTLIGYGTGLVAFVATVTLGTVVIAVGWFSARPLVSVGLIALAAMVVAVVVYLRRKKAAT